MKRRAAAHIAGAFIIIAPLAWGLMPVSFRSASSAALIIVACAAAVRRKPASDLDPNVPADRASPETKLAYRLALLLLAYMLLFHYLPWPAGLLQVLSPERANWANRLEPGQRWIRPALHPYGARETVALYSAALACVVIGYLSAGGFNARRQLLTYVALSGLLTAAAAVWLERYHPDFIGGRIEGPIRRSNAYASWQAMTLL